MKRNRIRCTAIEVSADANNECRMKVREFDFLSDPYLGGILLKRFPDLARPAQTADCAEFCALGARFGGLRAEVNPPFPESTFFPPGEREDWLRREGRPEQSP